MTFAEFMRRADAVILKASGGNGGVDDFADAPWRDLFEETGGETTDEVIIDTLCDYDDLFAMMAELQGTL